ncbi:alpha-2-macroglobulin family protein [Aureibacter tunicatorum]|uniref:TonB-dependent SusC/RagA subfamily outer membrane receptor n=1 Tax=Aureibacter tunicatorum TaxID=866807 RepID=A0AAE3XT60_9BACT|nr:alpha-2-macroglobulin family protein [Aureibacter tunicatorum]MDR6241545.1 TonB-dependent SusC/RagA subfamily outer membrane receptor [Aureibacter tunicatorum]BDD07231.1 hypothetical protein AUTU_47140 [Aureibacter tunicatorum]
MRVLFKLFFVIFLIYMNVDSWAQTNEITQHFSFRYKITDQQAKILYENPKYEIDSTFLTKFVRKVQSDDNIKNEKPGHYIDVKGNGNDDMYFHLKSNNYLYLLDWSNGAMQKFSFYDHQGNFSSQLTVKLGGKILKWNAEEQVYISKKYNKGILEVKSATGISFWEIVFSEKFTKNKFSWKKLFERDEDKEYDEDYFELADSEGFVLTNQPKYRPQDSVFYKAFITDKKGNKNSGAVRVYLTEEYNRDFHRGNYTFYNDEDDLIKIADLNPYRDGAYSGKFVLHDSLDLDLDEEYCILFTQGNKLLKYGDFYLEDYELPKYKTEFRAQSDDFYNENPVFYARAKDFNGFNVPGINCKLKIEKFYKSKVWKPYTFIPDLIWEKEMPLDPIGETKIEVPKDIFPDAKFSYYISIDFIASDGTLNKESEHFTYTPRLEKYSSIKIDGDTVKFDTKHKEKNAQLETTSYFGKKNTLYVSLPHKLSVDANTFKYQLFTAQDTSKKVLESRRINPIYSRTDDSLSVKISKKLPFDFNYTLYKGDKQIEYGKVKGSEADQWQLNRKINKNSTYSIAIHYQWGKTIQKNNFLIRKPSEFLKINHDLPAVVYPGEEKEINISITDKDSQKVKNADVTALAYNSQFKKSQAEDLPYYFEFENYRKQNRFFKKNIATEKKNIDQGKFIHLPLDTVVLHQMLSSKDIFIHKEAIEDKTKSWLSPFVVNNNKLRKTYMLKINDLWQYFEKTKQNYVFPVKEGLHSFVFRLNDGAYLSEKIMIEKGYRYWISFPEKLLTKFDYDPILSDEEWNQISPYMIKVKGSGNYNYLYEGEKIFKLDYFQKNLLGPIYNSEAELWKNNNYKMNIPIAGEYQYQITNDIIMMERKDLLTESHKVFNEKYWQNAPLHSKIINYKYLQKIDSLEKVNKSWKYDWINKKNQQNESVKIQWPKSEKNLFVILTKADDPSQILFKKIKLHNRSQQDNFWLPVGKYRLIAIDEEKNSIEDEFEVKADGDTYIIYDQFDTTELNLSRENINKAIKRVHSLRSTKNEIFINEYFYIVINELWKSYYPEKFEKYPLKINGKILNLLGIGIENAQVISNSSKNQTMSDSLGNFSMQITENDSLLYIHKGNLSRWLPIRNKIDVVTVLFERKKWYEKNILGNEKSKIFNDSILIKYRNNIDKKRKANYQFYDIEEVILEEIPLDDSLDEIFITASGVQRTKKSLGYAVTTTTSSSLNGKVAGVAISNNSQNSVIIRGQASISGNSQPIYIVDGMPVSSIDQLDPEQINSMSVLKGNAATALYGSRAANGVIIISTTEKKYDPKSKEMIALVENIPDNFILTNKNLNGIRADFRDYAYWQDRLKTDEEGKTSFKVKYPDDVTAWDNFIYVFDDQKRTGQAAFRTKSYKPLLAEISAPRFLIKGDQTDVVSKISNYTSEEVDLNAEFSEGTKSNSQQINVKNSHIDYHTLTADEDTLHFSYSINTPEGYYDGEKRKIPVFAQGIEKSKGEFKKLEQNNPWSPDLPQQGEKIIMSLQSHSPDWIIEQLDHVQKYPYTCNEQKASKILALLQKKRLYEQLDRKFVEKSSLKKLSAELIDNQMADGTWSWWNNNGPTSWFSTWQAYKAVEKLAENSKNKDAVKAKEKILINLENNLRDMPFRVQLETFDLLTKDKQKFYFERKIKDINSDSLEKHTLYQRLKINQIKRKLDLDDDKYLLKNEMKTDIFGNYYWTDGQQYSVEENKIATTLLALEMLEENNPNDINLQKIYDYLIEQRAYYWENTLLATNVMEALEKYFDHSNLYSGNAVVEVNIDGKTQEVDKFPFEQEIIGQSISIRKKSEDKLPVYASIYQRYQLQKPKADSTLFAVKTELVDEKDSIADNLLVGQRINLSVSIDAKKEASQVMLSIPIPAGCSYTKKSQAYYPESHREYYKDRIHIYLEKITEGKHQFEIPLTVRFAGDYTLNPTQVELMYFPTLDGNNELKKVKIIKEKGSETL